MRRNLLIFIIVFFASLFYLLAYQYVNGQSTSETTTTEPAPIAVDPSTVIASTGVIGAGTAIINSIMNNRKQNKNVRGTDLDVFKYICINNRIWATWSSNKDKTVDQILDMPMSDDPKDLDKTTFREALGREESEWNEFIDQEYRFKK